MPPWLRQWRDWAIPDLFASLRRVPTPAAQGLAFAYEKAGLVIRQEPIPWNADRVRVEAFLRFPSSLVRRRSDFTLVCDELGTLTPDGMQAETGSTCQVTFYLPPPRQATVVVLRWKDQPLGQAMLPVLREDVFFDHLQLQHAGVTVQLGDQWAACTAYPGTQGGAWLLGGLLTSPTSLAPLAGQELVIEIRPPRRSPIGVITRLRAEQLQRQEVLWQAQASKLPKVAGDWDVSWYVAGHRLAGLDMERLGRRKLSLLVQSLAVQYVARHGEEPAEVAPHLAATAEADWLGGLFVLQTTQPGLALRAPLELYLRHADGQRDALPTWREDVLITDGPTLVLPPLLARSEVGKLAGLELLCQGRCLARLATTPTPQAHFTAEGGFQAPVEAFPWSPAAESELAERLRQLSTS